MKQLLVLLGIAACVASCAPYRQTHERLHATLWTQVAAEYRAVCRQAYRLASRQLDRALHDPAWTAAVEQTPDYMNLPLAVIIDIDETILSSSGFNAALIQRGIGFDGELLKQWISSANGSPIPGASEFVNYAHSKGIAVFYITGRDVSEEAATREVLRAGGFPLRDDVDVVLTKNEREGWTRDKTSRRRHIAESYRVLLVVGDDLNDFVSGAYTSLRERSSVVEMYDDYWGLKWIILPNPVYGSWEGATYGFGYDLPDREKLRRKYEILSPIKYFLRRNASRLGWRGRADIDRLLAEGVWNAAGRRRTSRPSQSSCTPLRACF